MAQPFDADTLRSPVTPSLLRLSSPEPWSARKWPRWQWGIFLSVQSGEFADAHHLSHSRWNDPGDGGLHESGTGARQARGQARLYLGLRRGTVRDGHVSQSGPQQFTVVLTGRRDCESKLE
jgi:hypothetical protein